MTSPATLASSSPTDIDQHDLEVEESMLKRKAAILEEFLRNDGQDTTAIEDRCRILRRKIDLVEDELSIAGKSLPARRYLQEAPRSHFVVLTRDQFLEWLKNEGIKTIEAQKNLGPTRVAHQLNQGLHISPAPATTRGPSGKAKVGQDLPLPQSKRPRTDVNEKPPCLRCKILKKRCDSFEICTHCPVQSHDSSGDYWKVLGCFRGRLKDFSQTFCPDYSRATQRTINYRKGGVDTINFVLTKSRVSDTKKRRMLHLVQTSNEFSTLESSSWEVTEERKEISRKAISLNEYNDDSAPLDSIDFENYEAAWSVLQAVSMDPTYTKPTAYNLFTLLAQGNAFSKQQPAPWEIFKKAKQLLRQSVELYLLERLCGQIASGEMTSPPFDPLRETPNTLVLVDLKEDFESFLCSFERICAGRAKLTGHAQLACFYALLVMSVTKSMLIDAHSLRDGYEGVSSWNQSDPVKIASAFRVLIGVFCWASKSDVVLQAVHGGDAEWSLIMHKTRSMVRDDLWPKRGFKGSKEFLLGLGSCWYADRVYNGFFVQRLGLDSLPAFSGKPVTTCHEDSPARPVSRNGSLEGSSAVGTLNSRSSPSRSSKGASVSAETLTWISQNQPQPEELRFSPTSASNTPLIFVGQENDDDRDSTGRSRRKGALNDASLVNAREIRKIGACWNCWVLKVPCSEGESCHRCRNKAGSRVYRHCNRGSFKKLFSEMFFPEFVVAQYSKQAIQEYIKLHTLEFERHEFDVVISWGGDVARKVQVSPFTPSPESVAQLTYLARDGRDLGVESLPVGLANDDVFTEQDFLDLLESNLESGNVLICASPRHSSSLSLSVLQAISQFHNSTEVEDQVTRQGLLLCSAIKAASCPLLIEEESAASVLEHLSNIKEDDKLYSSRLLNRQMKSVMFSTCQQLTIKFLAELEKLVRKRQRSLWPVCFTGMLLLCLVIEQVQTLVDAHIQVMKSSEPDLLVGLENEPKESCQILDTTVYEQLAHIFHTIYRTKKEERDGCNPFGDLQMEEDAGFDEASMAMIRELKDRALNFEILDERDQPLDYELGPEEFATRNSGRLLANFLTGFMQRN